MTFATVIRIIFALMLVISALVGRRVVNWAAAFGRTPVERRRLKVGVWALLLFLNIPVFYFLLIGIRARGGHPDQSWYLFFLYPYFAWQMAAIVMAVILAVKAIVGLPYRVWSWFKRAKSDTSGVSQSRRDFLAKTATALPAGLLLTTGYGIVNAQTDFEWFEHDVKLRDWPRELQGLRILQVSDTHVGSFMSGEKLSEYVEAINQKKFDMLMITGDIIDHNITWLPDCFEALSKFRIPEHGAYVCIGNHDYYSGGAPELMSGIHDMGMRVVLDNHVTVPVRGKMVNIAGLDYPRGGMHFEGSDRFVNHVKRALAGKDPDAPTILLSHHPHAFDPAADAGVQLTLAGHTHGGQFAFNYPGGRISVGDLMFKYVAGLYTKDGAHVYVNRGIGNWFPMRLGAPPEVTILNLV